MNKFQVNMYNDCNHLSTGSKYIQNQRIKDSKKYKLFNRSMQSSILFARLPRTTSNQYDMSFILDIIQTQRKYLKRGFQFGLDRELYMSNTYILGCAYLANISVGYY